MSLRFPSLTQARRALGPRVQLPAAGRDRKPARPRVLRGPTPHDMLWDAVGRLGLAAEREYRGAVPGRRYRLDIAIPAARLAIEVDGWQWHGKHKRDFARDRERQNLLTLHGWRILRFSAGQIRAGLASCVRMIEAAAVRLERPGQGAGRGRAGGRR